MAGLDTTADVEAAKRDLSRIEKSLKKLTRELEPGKAKGRAEALASEIKAYRKQLS